MNSISQFRDFKKFSRISSKSLPHIAASPLMGTLSRRELKQIVAEMVD